MGGGGAGGGGGAAPAGGGSSGGAGGGGSSGGGFHNIDELPLGKTLQISFGRKKRSKGHVGKLMSKGFPKK